MVARGYISFIARINIRCTVNTGSLIKKLRVEDMKPHAQTAQSVADNFARVAKMASYLLTAVKTATKLFGDTPAVIVSKYAH